MLELPECDLTEFVPGIFVLIASRIPMATEESSALTPENDERSPVSQTTPCDIEIRIPYDMLQPTSLEELKNKSPYAFFDGWMEEKTYIMEGTADW